MPLKSGKSKQAVSDNIKELMDEYKHGDGKIGNYRPPSAKKAQKAAVAIAMKKAGKSRNRTVR
jgi:hypothetical protein